MAKKLERDLTVPGHLHCSAVPIRSAVPLTTMLAAMTSGSTQMDSTKKVCGEHQGGPEGTEHRHVQGSGPGSTEPCPTEGHAEQPVWGWGQGPEAWNQSRCRPTQDSPAETLAAPERRLQGGKKNAPPLIPGRRGGPMPCWHERPRKGPPRAKTCHGPAEEVSQPGLTL